MNALVFGAAREVITPPMPATMIGFGTVFGKTFTDIHDDLFVRALVLRDAKSHTLVFMAFDLLFHDETLNDRIAEYAARQYRVERAAVVVNYTHTHYGPAVKGYDFNFYRPEYETFLYERAKTCLDRAFLTLREGTMETCAVTGDWNLSRRLPRGGDMDFAPNLDGPRDPELRLLRLRDRDGRTRALLCNYGCHPSNLNAYRTLSSEYPGRLCALLEAYNYGCTALFCQGAGSDTKLKAGGRSSAGFAGLTFDELDEAAASMARRVQGTLLNGAWRAWDADFAAVRFTIPLPLTASPRERFEKELDEASRHASEPFTPDLVPPDDYSGRFLTWANAQYVVRHYDELSDTLPLSCAALRLADGLHVLTMGGEPTCDFRRVLGGLPGVGEFFFIGYTDAIAYVPTDKLIAEGGYEAGGRSVTEYRHKGEFAPGADALYLRCYGEALRAL